MKTCHTHKEQIVAEQYTVWAYSPSQHQEVRLVTSEHPPTQLAAEQAAEFFIAGLNERQYLQAGDWQARIKYEPVGFESLEGWVPGQTQLIQ
jgi:hypothetical protein